MYRAEELVWTWVMHVTPVASDLQVVIESTLTLCVL